MANATTENQHFQQFKASQKEVWSGFAVNEGFTSIAAGDLIEFAGVQAGQAVLDVGCGTGVAGITAAVAGAVVKGLDLTPALLERARENALIAKVQVEFIEGDVEAMPFPDSSFDVVLSQFGHMFAPRPEVATAEMLRVLKAGGRIAFSTWPPEHVTGMFFMLLARNGPELSPDAPKPAPPVQWGDPNVIRARLGDAVTDLRFDRSEMLIPALSARHVLTSMQANFGPLKKLMTALDANNPEQAAAIRAELLGLISEHSRKNRMRQSFLMTRATKLA